MTDSVSVSQKESIGLGRNGFKTIWLLYLILGFFLTGVIAFATFRPILVLPRITLAPGFSLIDQDGNRLTNEDMRGKITLYNISHTQCSFPCRETGVVMKEVQDNLSGINSGNIPVELVTISINPDHDTPEQLKSYARSLQADNNSWHFVTGEVDRLKMIVGGGFGLYFNKHENNEIVFEPGFMLVDGLGILRAEYRTASPDTKRILSDIELIAEEVNNSEGANKVAYEAAHLFMCYPK